MCWSAQVRADALQRQRLPCSNLKGNCCCQKCSSLASNNPFGTVLSPFLLLSQTHCWMSFASIIYWRMENCVPTPRSCLVLCPFQNLRKTRTPPGSQMLCFAIRVIFSAEYRNMKQGKKVCKATAIRCYQAFSLRLLRLLWTLHIMSNSAPVSFQTLPGSLSYTCQVRSDACHVKLHCQVIWHLSRLLTRLSDSKKTGPYPNDLYL